MGPDDTLIAKENPISQADPKKLTLNVVMAQSHRATRRVLRPQVEETLVPGKAPL
jgi:hypothetical protein